MADIQTWCTWDPTTTLRTTSCLKWVRFQRSALLNAKPSVSSCSSRSVACWDLQKAASVSQGRKSAGGDALATGQCKNAFGSEASLKLGIHIFWGLGRNSPAGNA